MATSLQLGPDFIFGTKDDLDVQLGVDAFASDEQFEGINDTLNTVAFGLSTGKGAASRSAGIASSATFAASGSYFGVTPIDSRSGFNTLESKEEQLAVL